MDANLIFRLKRETMEEMQKYKKQLDHIISQNSDCFILDKKLLGISNQPISIRTHDLSANHAGFHGHDFFEMVYVVSGCGYQTLADGHEIQLNRGDCCIMNPYASHSYRIQNENDITINLLMNASLFNDSFFSFVANFKAVGKFYLDYLLSACTKEGQSSIIFHNKNPEKTDVLIEYIIQEYFKNSTYIETNVRCYLILLYSELMNQTSEVQPEQEKRITDIIEYLANNLKTATLNSTAEHFYLHPNYLSNYIKKQTGRTFAETLSELKLVQSKYLLLNTEYTISDIAELMGYKETVSFHNMFKKKTTFTPAQFRNMQR